MSKWLLAVTGSGASTEYCIADQQGSIQFSLFTGSTSIKSVGNATALAHIQEGLRAIRSRGIEIEDIVCGIWGMSGCDTPEDKLVYEALLGTAGLPDCHHVMNEALLSYWANAQVPGILVGAGMGSIVMGLDSQGEGCRVGGWNYIFSDLGSGYWLGRRLLRETLLWLDDCREADPVYQRVWQQAAPRAKDALEAIYTLSKISEPGQIAALAPLALDSTDSPICSKIRDEAVVHLLDYMKTVYRKLCSKGETNLKVVLSGSQFQSEVFRQEFTEAVAREWGERLPVIWGQHDPVEGGIRLAGKQ